ncbi:hypothetical protein KC717_02875, partial [Candidatus Dojkabacteria bacterium]|nr:hypothetical protein [Candidatus Dojkabacteria bacterium]
MMKSNNTEPSLNSKALWALFGGGFLGAAIFVLFWKQSLGLNILLSTVIWFVFVQITKIITQKRFYSSKWDLLFIPFFIIGIGTFINDSRSMNAISIVL